MERPNIVFYFSDQQRHDTVTEEIMPNLSALAEEGALFENAFTCQPVCGPARACLQTGVYATQNKSTVNGIPLNAEIKPLAEYFNEAGYETAYIGKWHLASDLPGIGLHCETSAVPRERQGGYGFWRAADVLEFTSHGYDGYVFDGAGNRLDFEGYRADRINDYALEFLENRRKDKPFFLFVSQLEPHHQNDRGRFEAPEGYAERFADAEIPADLTAMKGDYAAQYPAYLGCVRALDDNVGRLTEKLKELGLYDNTIFLYASDHGCHFRTRNAEYKRSCHDASLHTPLVARGGVFDGCGRDDRLVSLIDLPATLLDLAGIPVPASYMGISLAAQLRGAAGKRDCCFAQISESHVGRCVRTERYTYSVRARRPLWNRERTERMWYDDYLYDNETDPAQRENRVRDPRMKAVKEELRALLAREMIAAGEQPPVFRTGRRRKKI